MFETYPETFKMHVYPSRRSCAVPPEVLKLTEENAKLTDEGEGLEGIVEAFTQTQVKHFTMYGIIF